MAEIGAIEVDLRFVVGQTRMPLAQFLKLGRGGVILLDTPKDVTDSADTPLSVEANGHEIGKAKVVLHGEEIAVAMLPASNN